MRGVRQELWQRASAAGLALPLVQGHREWRLIRDVSSHQCVCVYLGQRRESGKVIPSLDLILESFHMNMKSNGISD